MYDERNIIGYKKNVYVGNQLKD